MVFLHADPANPAWFFGRDAAGTQGYFPAGWFGINETDRSAVACRDYDAMEITVEIGDAIAIEEEYGGWAFVTSAGKRGWVPRSCLPPPEPPDPPI